MEYNKNSNRFLLKKVDDLRKDQSYFLYKLSQEQLSKVIFPLHRYTKEQVRDIAKELGLNTSNKSDSQNFYSGNYTELFKNEPCPGPIIDINGKVLGEHKGIHFYTIGQRKGLSISSTHPYYVVNIDESKNVIIVGNDEDLYKDKLIASDLNWVAIEKLNKPLNVKARIRYKHKEAEAKISPYENSRVLVEFKKPQRAITPGQAVVFYIDDIVIGGGTIEKIGGEYEERTT